MDLCLEAASDEPGVALASAGVAALTLTWHTQQNHSKELLPNIDRLLQEAGRAKADIEAVFVDIGPGGYAGLRVGVSIAKGLAHGLGVPIVGIGRLELDAWSVAEDARGRRIVAVHRAGRGDVAWAAYRQEDGAQQAANDNAIDPAAWGELAPPQMTKPDEMLRSLQPADVVTGDVDPAWQQPLSDAGASIATPRQHRVVALAALGHARLTAGRLDDAAALVPLYLRAPAIGPQRQG